MDLEETLYGYLGRVHTDILMVECIVIQYMFRGIKEGRVRDPVSAVFELADEIRGRIGRMRAVFMFAIIAGIAFTVMGVILITVFWYFTNYELLILSFVLAAISLYITGEAFRQDGYLFSIETRTDVLRRARFWNPSPKIPEGESHAHRFVRYLVQSDEKFMKELSKSKTGVRYATAVQGKSGRSVSFDAYFYRRTPFTVFGFQLCLRCFDSQLTIEDLKSLKMDVEDVIRKKRYPAMRVIALQTAGDEISEDVLEFADTEWISYPVGKSTGKEVHACPIEPISLDPSGKYRLEIVYFS